MVNGVFVFFGLIAWLTQDLDIARPITPTLCQWNNMVTMKRPVQRQLFPTMSTPSFLAFVYTLNVFSSCATFSAANSSPSILCVLPKSGGIAMVIINDGNLVSMVIFGPSLFLFGAKNKFILSPIGRHIAFVFLPPFSRILFSFFWIVFQPSAMGFHSFFFVRLPAIASPFLFLLWISGSISRDAEFCAFYAGSSRNQPFRHMASLARLVGTEAKSCQSKFSGIFSTNDMRVLG